MMKFILMLFCLIAGFVFASEIVITQKDIEQYEMTNKMKKDNKMKTTEIIDTDTQTIYNSVILLKVNCFLSDDTIEELRKYTGLEFAEVERILEIIKSLPYYGTGFFISDTGYICTNKHLFEEKNYELNLGNRTINFKYNYYSIEGIINSGSEREEVIYPILFIMDYELDLAILSSSYSPPNVINIKNYEIPNIGKQAKLCGFPMGKAPQELLKEVFINKKYEYPEYPELSINIGNVTSLRRDKDGNIDLIQLDIRANPGNSGSPVLDTENKFIGILTSRIRGGISMDYVIPADKVVNFVKRYLGENEFGKMQNERMKK